MCNLSFVQRLPRCISLTFYCFMVLISLRLADDDKSIETILSVYVKDQGNSVHVSEPESANTLLLCLCGLVYLCVDT